MLLAVLLAAAVGQTTPAEAAPVRQNEISVTKVRTVDVVADLYVPVANGPSPALILLGGSEGGLAKGAGRDARLLASLGYAVLHLSYFGSPGQPDTLQQIPLETFGRAIDWLKDQHGIDPSRVGIIGISKGAEAALLIATRRKDLKITVLGSPSSVAWPGIASGRVVSEAAWTEGGKPVPFVPYGWTGTYNGIHAIYADGLANTAAVAKASIPAERVFGQIVMVCGERDTLWPSCPMARAVRDRLGKHGLSHRVTLLAYPDAGHGAFGPPIEATPGNVAMVAALGGTMEGTIAAREQGWPMVLKAIDHALRPQTPR